MALVDGFHRANSSTLGTADSGQAYTAGYGVIGINTNLAVQPTGQFSEAWVDIGTTDFDYATSVAGNGVGMSLRVQDQDNVYALYASGGTTVNLDVYVAGFGTNVASAAYAYTLPSSVTSGPYYVMRAKAVGTTLDVWFDGVHQFTATMSHFTTSTKIGLFSLGTSPARNHWGYINPTPLTTWQLGPIRVI